MSAEGTDGGAGTPQDNRTSRAAATTTALAACTTAAATATAALIIWPLSGPNIPDPATQAASAATLASGLGVLTAWAATSLSKRCRQITTWMGRIEAGNLEEPIRPTGSDEIAEAGRAIEELRNHRIRARRMQVVQQLSGVVATRNDRLEEALKALQETQDQLISQQKLAELGEMAAGVAHELRNPLHFIQNFSEASEGLLDELTELAEQIGKAGPSEESREQLAEVTNDLRENLSRMRAHSERADRIIEDMLSMGRDSSGKFRKVDVNQLVDMHAKLAYHASQSEHAETSIHLRDAMDPNTGEAWMIPEDVSRVILNVVSNACYATWERARKEEGDDQYRPEVTIGTRREGDTAIITVADNGIGMDEDTRSKIFNPFFTTKPNEDGTGLGLALSHDVVREHGGTIEVESEPNNGTTVAIMLPTGRPEREEDIAEDEESPD